MNIWRIGAAALCLWVGVALICLGKVVCVDERATEAGNGTSRADAYSYLYDALIDANTSEKPVEIRVATGIHRPDEDVLHPDRTGDGNATLRLINSVILRAGYAGFSEPDLSGQKGERMTVWVNCKTDLPVRILLEISARADGPSDDWLEYYDFTWNEPLDEELFSLEVPEGYTLADPLLPY